MKHLSFLAGPVLVTSMIWPAATAPSAVLNVPVAARVISFVQPSPVGLVPIGIVYQPGNAASEAEASDMERMLSGGFTLGRATLRTRRVAVTNLNQLTGTKAAFVTTGLRAHQDEVAAAASAQSILTITADAGCVVAGRCIVGISGASKTQIIVNKAAARRSGIRFGSAFLMLVKEI
ncbi:MAG: YfiR family protein [Sphingomonas sp.]|nr:MAG: YfiR family protein [Sphingomonas sp.]